jgi:hypothetical protein
MREHILNLSLMVAAVLTSVVAALAECVGVEPDGAHGRLVVVQSSASVLAGCQSKVPGLPIGVV